MREQQQLLDELAHPLRLHTDAVQRPLQVRWSVTCPAFEQLGVCADGGQRGAQLVGDVGDEAAHPLLGVAQRLLGRVALGERAADSIEHRVHRRSQPPNLGRPVAAGHPVVEIAAVGDQQRRLLDSP